MKPQLAALAFALTISILGSAAFATPPTRQVVRKATQPAQMYTCPMHGDVRWTRPGACPECGMKMVATKRTARMTTRQDGSAPTPGMTDEPTSADNHAGMEMEQRNTGGMGGMSGGMRCGACMDIGEMSGAAAPAARKAIGAVSYGGGGGRSCGCL